MLDPSDLRRLGENLELVRQRVATACLQAGRDPREVELVAVTKYAGPAYAWGLLQLGQRDLGENRVDHLLALAAALEGRAPHPPRWHMIGHLQRNKARKVAGLLDVLHSLDNAPLAMKLDAARPADRPPLRAYVQLRLDPQAEDRSGIAPVQLGPLLRELAGLTRLEIVGLMGLPPLGSPEDARPHFVRLREALRGASELRGVRGLSMGMTSDLEVAIEEGATVVRVGRALLEGLSEAALRS